MLSCRKVRRMEERRYRSRAKGFQLLRPAEDTIDKDVNFSIFRICRSVMQREYKFQNSAFGKFGFVFQHAAPPRRAGRVAGLNPVAGVADPGTARYLRDLFKIQHIQISNRIFAEQQRFFIIRKAVAIAVCLRRIGLIAIHLIPIGKSVAISIFILPIGSQLHFIRIYKAVFVCITLPLQIFHRG